MIKDETEFDAANKMLINGKSISVTRLLKDEFCYQFKKVLLKRNLPFFSYTSTPFKNYFRIRPTGVNKK